MEASYIWTKMRTFATFAVFVQLLIHAVSGQECTDTLGSLSHDNNIVPQDQTFILAGYTVPCNSTVVAWEFCYLISAVTSVTFYPGIWRVTGTSGSNTDYELVQSNYVTYTSIANISNLYPCQTMNLSVTDQFTAPAGSVVGLYSNIQTQLLHTNTDSSIITYQFSGNQSSVHAGLDDEVNYSIAIRVHLGIGCVDLSPPANGEIVSCSSGRVGEGYEGDTCSFSCNTGYELTGSDTRTCQSDGSWSGSDNMCIRVTCEDLETPSNGSINCSSNNQPLQYQDNCIFQCNDGYEVQGSVMRQCEASGEWSGSRTQCNIRHCPNITTLVPNSRSCDTSYTSTCMVECKDGYNRSGDSSQYSCGLNGTEVVWMFTGSGVTCSPVPCINLSDPENGNVTCPSNTSVFQDTCTYYCNRGYQLEGNRQTRCNADGTWSSEPVTCTILKCNDPEVKIANSQSVGVCNVTYGSSCSLNCSSGYGVSGNGEHVCDDVNDEGTSVKWRSVGRAFSCVATGTFPDSDSSIRSSVPIIAGSVGGAVLVIIILFFLMILCVRRFHKKKSHTFDNSMVSETNSDIKMNTNPSISITKQNKGQENEYEDVLPYKTSFQNNAQTTIKMQSNPSYGRLQGCNAHDAAIKSNPSCDLISKETSMVYEDEDGYAETNSLSVQKAKVIGSASDKGEYYNVATDNMNNVKINLNPSYNSVSGGIKLEDNPSYHKTKQT